MKRQLFERTTQKISLDTKELRYFMVLFRTIQILCFLLNPEYTPDEFKSMKLSATAVVLNIITRHTDLLETVWHLAHLNYKRAERSNKPHPTLEHIPYVKYL